MPLLTERISDDAEFYKHTAPIGAKNLVHYLTLVTLKKAAFADSLLSENLPVSST